MEFGTVILFLLAALIVITLVLSIKIIPQSENWVVERIGKYDRTLQAGLHIIVPFFETIRYRVLIQEIQLPPDPINAITHDNVAIYIQLAILYRITDAAKTMYRIENLSLAIKTIVNGTVRMNCCQFRSTTKESFSIVNHCSNIG